MRTSDRKSGCFFLIFSLLALHLASSFAHPLTADDKSLIAEISDKKIDPSCHYQCMKWCTANLPNEICFRPICYSCSSYAWLWDNPECTPPKFSKLFAKSN